MKRYFEEQLPNDCWKLLTAAYLATVPTTITNKSVYRYVCVPSNADAHWDCTGCHIHIHAHVTRSYPSYVSTVWMPICSVHSHIQSDRPTVRQTNKHYYQFAGNAIHKLKICYVVARRESRWFRWVCEISKAKTSDQFFFLIAASLVFVVIFHIRGQRIRAIYICCWHIIRFFWCGIVSRCQDNDHSRSFHLLHF